MPDVGLSDDAVSSVKRDFENNLVGSLERVGLARPVVVVVEIVVVFAEPIQ